MTGHTTPCSPQQVIAGELIDRDFPGSTSPNQARTEWAQDIMNALAEHGFAVVSIVVSIVEPQEEGRAGG